MDVLSPTRGHNVAHPEHKHSYTYTPTAKHNDPQGQPQWLLLQLQLAC
jgi:hypothetical protein